MQKEKDDSIRHKKTKLQKKWFNSIMTEMCRVVVVHAYDAQ
jgi:hypothetical protein